MAYLAAIYENNYTRIAQGTHYYEQLYIISDALERRIRTKAIFTDWAAMVITMLTALGLRVEMRFWLLMNLSRVTRNTLCFGSYK